MNKIVRQTLIKKTILEMTFFGVVILISASMLSKLSPTYSAKRFSASGSTDIALVSVPVPVQSDMEGRKVQYTVNCTMKHGALECVEAS